MATLAKSRDMGQMIDNSRGRIFGVTFRKKDNTVRHLVGRMGVAKNLKGGSNNSDPAKYITVWDMQASAYRLVNRDTIIELNINRTKYQVA